MSYQERKARPDIRSTSSFVAIPSAFEGLQGDARFVPKLEFKTVYNEESEMVNLETVLATDKILFDLAALNASEIDMGRVSNDIAYFQEKLDRDPEKVTRLVEKVGGDSPDVADAIEIMEELEVTEEDFVEAGGGLVFLVAAGAAVLATGCISKADKVRHESTFPEQPSGDSDAGPDGGQ